MVNLATEITSINKTDMKSHGPGPLSFALDWQPRTKVNVPSCRFADGVVATAGSVSERSRSLEQVACGAMIVQADEVQAGELEAVSQFGWCEEAVALP
jgi:hypothetical protein